MDGYSPAMPIVGPALTLCAQGNQEMGFAARQSTRDSQVSLQNKSHTKREVLPVDCPVLIQDVNSKQLDQFGTIIEVRLDNLSYLVITLFWDYCSQGPGLVKKCPPALRSQVSTITKVKPILLPSNFCRQPNKHGLPRHRSTQRTAWRA